MDPHTRHLIVRVYGSAADLVGTGCNVGDRVRVSVNSIVDLCQWIVHVSQSRRLSCLRLPVRPSCLLLCSSLSVKIDSRKNLLFHPNARVVVVHPWRLCPLVQTRAELSTTFCLMTPEPQFEFLSTQTS